MNTTPTYVIGIGGVGVKVISAFQDRVFEDTVDSAVGLMAIDSDRERLEEVSEVPTLHLKSGSGLLGDTADRYPFLTSDEYVPERGTKRQRHLGRYKLDNTVSPTFTSHRQTISGHLEHFIDDVENALEEKPGTYNVTLVISLAGGTGSGTFPLFTGLLQDIKREFSSTSRQIRIFAVGVVPPLDSIQKVYEPCAYVNTFASLRNLETLLDSRAEQLLEVPVYSLRNTGGSNRTNRNQHHISVERPGLDACWLVDGGQAVRTDKTLEYRDVVSNLSEGLYALTTQTPKDCEPLAHGSTTSPLGTFRYASVVIPHERLNQYCELKSNRDAVEEELEEYVRPRLESLRTRKRTLESALNTELPNEQLDGEWINRVFNWLETGPDTRRDFVYETGPDELDETLDRFSDDVVDYLQAATALDYDLSKNGEAGSTVYSEVQQTIRTVRDIHDDELESRITTITHSPEEMLDILTEELKEQKETYQQQRSREEPTVRDYLPPICESFISEREHLSRAIARIEYSLDTLDTANENLNSLDNLQSVAQEHKKKAREKLRREVDRVERDITHFLAELERLRDKLQRLEREISTARTSLAQPNNSGPIRYLPLDWEELQAVTLEDHGDLTSIHAYKKFGLIDGGEKAVHELLQECYRDSRNWATSISRHELSVPRESVHESTFVLYHEENHPLVGGLRSEFTEPDVIRSSAGQSTSFTENPFRIEIISLSHGGTASSLEGFQRLKQLEETGTLQDLATNAMEYKDYRRAIAYPEWYDNS